MKKTAAIIGALGTVLALRVGLRYFLYHEVIDSDGKIFSIIGNAVTKKKVGDDSGEEKEPDDRVTWFHNQKFEEYEIESDDGIKLKGYLLPAEKKTNRFVFCSHGYRSSGKDGFTLQTKFLHDQGLNVFLVDHRGCGESDGRHITFGNKESKDCIKWLNFLIEKFGDDIQIAIYGVSLGSATVMMMTGDETLPDNVKFTVADCGYTSAWNEFADVIDVMGPVKYPLLYGANAFSKAIAGFDFKDTDALESVKHAKIPILFIHGGNDDFIKPTMCYELYEATSAPAKDILIVDGAWHAKSYETNSEIYEAKFKEYIDKYFD